MRIISWNVQRIKKKVGAGAIATAILNHNPSIIALHEFNLKVLGRKLASALAVENFVPYASPFSGKYFRTIVFAPPGAQIMATPAALDGHDAFWIELRSARLGISTVYIPPHSKNYAASRAAHWQAVLTVARSVKDRPHLIIGDLNTTLHGVDEKNSSVPGEEYLKELEKIGWVEAWRKLHQFGPIIERYSWFSNSRNGFRLDQAWLSPSLVPHLSDTIMDHDVRERQLSDHSMLIVDLNL